MRKPRAAEALSAHAEGGAALFSSAFLAALGDAPWDPQATDREAAALLHLELTSRIATQPLAYSGGDEKAALTSVFALFGRAREICETHLAARAFELITWHVLNSHVRPFTARWHPRSEAGHLRALDATDEFRGELLAVQKVLIRFDRLLLELRDDGISVFPPIPAPSHELLVSEMMQPVAPGLGIAEPECDRRNNAEASHIAARRKHYLDLGFEPPSGTVGLALSGGGIRSATFSLGVLSALAQRSILPQVDYLSTVSGGGYLGAFLASVLASPDAKPDAPAIGLARGQQPLDATPSAPTLGHLRLHARFLINGSALRRAEVAFAQIGGLLINLLALTALVVATGMAVAGLAMLIDRGTAALFAAVIPPAWPAGLAGSGLLLFVGLVVAPLAAGLDRRAERIANLVLFGLAGIFAAVLLHHALEAVQSVHRVVIGNDGTRLAATLLVPLALLIAATALERVLPLGKAVARIVARGAAPLFLILMFLAAGAWHNYSSDDAVTLGATLAALVVLGLALNLNFTGLHRHYRDQLAATFVVASTPEGTVEVQAGRLLSELVKRRCAPYPIFNAAINVPASRDPLMRGRLSDLFSLTPDFCGSLLTGYRPTREWESSNPGLTLATAMAVSGAAVAPQMGLKGGPFGFWITLLNARLDWWVRNPAHPGLMPYPWLRYLLRALSARIDETTPFLNLSDGGHIENLGVYELLRRRCKYVIAIDGEQDEAMTFHALANLQRLATIDLGVRIDIDLDDLRRGSDGLSRSHFQFARINYPGGDTGYLIYMKLSLTGNEGEFLRRFKLDEPDFPHRPTLDQNFTEVRFEAYRSLGEHVGSKLFMRSLIGSVADNEMVALEAWFVALGRSLLPAVELSESARGNTAGGSEAP